MSYKSLVLGSKAWFFRSLSSQIFWGQILIQFGNFFFWFSAESTCAVEKIPGLGFIGDYTTQFYRNNKLLWGFLLKNQYNGK